MKLLYECVTISESLNVSLLSWLDWQTLRNLYNSKSEIGNVHHKIQNVAIEFHIHIIHNLSRVNSIQCTRYIIEYFPSFSSRLSMLIVQSN